MILNGNVTAIILAAGSGSRMKLGITKQRMVIDEESVLRRTVKAFNLCDEISSIVVVVRSDEIAFAKSELSDLEKVNKIVVGGESRVESAKIGFCATGENSDYIAIHDGARCFITDDMIKAVIRDAKTYGAATASCIITDTVKKIDSNGDILATVDRNSLVFVQTPQVFKTELYKKALDNTELYDSSITDDNMLLERIGVKVHCTNTGKDNIKLTVKEDLKYAEYLVNGGKNNV